MQMTGQMTETTGVQERMGTYNDKPLKLEGKTLVVGMGKTGLSCARYLLSQGESVVIWDNRQAPPLLAEIENILPADDIVLGPFNGVQFSQCKQIIVSPGVSINEQAIQHAHAQGVAVFGDVELFARHVNAPVIAITGSNGKSTVTALVAAMLECSGCDVRIGANFGTPALDLLQTRTPDVYVLELSSFQLETTTSLNAVASVVLNISPDHMDRYDSVSTYMMAKQQIWSGKGVVVLNRDEPALLTTSIKGRRQIGFTLSVPGATDYGVRIHAGQPWLARGEICLIPVADLKLNGRHNIANALAALALVEALFDHMAASQPQLSTKLSRADALQALADFPGLPHRMEWIAEAGGVNWYNDSKGTNVGATLAALQGIDGRVVLIAGGLAKDGDFAPLRPVLAEKGRVVILIGRDAPLIESVLTDVVACVHADDMNQVVAQAQQYAQAGDVVLLSPACASFDMFNGYEHRGQVFADAVRRALT